MRNLFTKRLMISTAAATMLFGSAITANAAQEDLFDAEYYAETYPDVAAAVGNDENALLQHYLAYGITEGRNANAYFNTLAYRNAYADLDAAFGDNWDAYADHYVAYGISEGRSAVGDVVVPSQDITPVEETVVPATSLAEADALLANVCQVLSGGDWSAITLIDGSDEAEAVVALLGASGLDRYVYVPADNVTKTGMGAGVYPFNINEDGTWSGYAFYYGNYVNGVRSGEGALCFRNSESTYYVFEGQWQSDAPNGNGTATTVEESYSKISQGNLVNGLWDGYVNAILNDYDELFDFSFTAVNGIPTEDRTAELEAADYSFYAEDYLEDGAYVYAYDTHWYIGYDEDDDEYEYPYSWYAYTYIGNTVGIATFADAYK